jgi:hypothetical protein
MLEPSIVKIQHLSNISSCEINLLVASCIYLLLGDSLGETLRGFTIPFYKFMQSS